LKNTKGLSTDDESILEKNLVWIFADRRSGTTWLAKELLSFKTNFMDEPLIGLHLGKFNMTKTGVKRTLNIQENRNDYFFSKEYKEVWKFFLRKLILNRIHSQFNDLNKKIIIKEPSGSISADLLSEILSTSKIIILLRDGRDIIDSKIDEVSGGGWELKLKKGIKQELTEEKRISHIKNTSKFWISLMEILLKTYNNHSKNLRYKLRYEDLLKNTQGELKKLYQFLEIEIDDKNLETIVEQFKFENVPQKLKGAGKFKRFASPGKWKENFNDKEKDLMNNLLKEMLQRLEY